MFVLSYFTATLLLVFMDVLIFCKEKVKVQYILVLATIITGARKNCLSKKAGCTTCRDDDDDVDDDLLYSCGDGENCKSGRMCSQRVEGRECIL